MTNESDIQYLISSESKTFSFSIGDIQTILPLLIENLKENREDYVFEKGRLDREVGKFISENLRLKYLSVSKDDVVDLENRIREGKYGRIPKLNPK